MPFVFQGLRFEEVPSPQSVDGAFNLTLQFRPLLQAAQNESNGSQPNFSTNDSAFGSRPDQPDQYFDRPSSTRAETRQEHRPLRLTENGNGDFPAANFQRPTQRSNVVNTPRPGHGPEAGTVHPLDDAGKTVKKTKKRARFRLAWTSIRDIFSIASSAAQLAT